MASGGGPGGGSGSSSQVSGHLFSAVGATLNAYSKLFSSTDPTTVTGAGSIRNTGSNPITIKEDVTDKYGTNSLTHDIDPGMDFLLYSTVAIAGGLPPYLNYTVSVKSKNSGQPSTFSYAFKES